MSRRVLVTGGFGYLGLAAVCALAESGWDVVAWGHRPRNEEALTRLPPAIARVFDGVRDCERMLAELGPLDAVVHLAGGGGPAKIAADPIAGIRNNVRATSELALAAKRAGLRRLLFASTIAVYGTERNHGRPYAEDDAPQPDDIYGVVKEVAEQVWVGHAGGTALRLSNIYGAGIGVDMGVAGAVERFARAAATGGEIRLFGGGKQRIDYVHVDDVTRAIRLALDHESPPPCVNVGGGNPIRLRDMAEICVTLGREVGTVTTVVEQPAPPGKSWPDRSLAIELARRSIGWEPAVAYADGLRELIRMMQSAPGAKT